MSKTPVLGSFNHLSLCVGDYEESIKFYDSFLTQLGYKQKIINDKYTMWINSLSGGQIAISPTRPENKESKHVRYSVGYHHIALNASSREQVDKFHEFLVKNDYKVLDEPKEYDYVPGYYAVFWTDLDGMKFELCHVPIPNVQEDHTPTPKADSVEETNGDKSDIPMRPEGKDHENSGESDENVNVIGTVTEKPNIHLPKNITVPTGNKFKFLLSAYGVQIYKCVVNKDGVPNNWTQVTPDTYCVNDKRTESFVPEYEVAYHYFLKKPIHEGRAVWESLVKGDDSLLVAKSVATNVSPDGNMHLPWLVNEVTYHEGKGRFSDITYVLRVNTVEGNPPPNEYCGIHYQGGAIVKVAYSADY
ncbi:16836_t:CDS:2, partial [Funneliformis caledonium]